MTARYGETRREWVCCTRGLVSRGKGQAGLDGTVCQCDGEVVGKEDDVR